MTFTKTFSIITALSLVGHSSVSAQNNGFDFEFVAGTVANFRQIPNQVRYEGGTFDLFVRDGLLTFQAGCQAPFYFPPGTPGCEAGATGYLTAGDIDGDGLEDSGDYFLVLAIARAAILRPFAPEEVMLISAPPSQLPRPLAGFSNDSRSVFFNIQTEFIRQYDITQYGFAREYTPAERNRFDKEVVPGSYIYSFPSIASATIPTNIAINRFATLDGYREINNQDVGFRFLGVTYDDGFAVLNPFQINTLRWEGNSVSFVNPVSDSLYLSIKALQDPTDPLSDPDPGLPIFPNFTGNPTEPRVVLPSPLDTSYVLAPNFLAPGQTGLLDLEFSIVRRTNAVVYDESIRRFRMPVKVSNPFALPPPPNVSEAVFNDFNGDFDNDGVTNFEEWVFDSDRANPASVPVAPKLGFVAPVTTTSSDPVTGPIAGTFSEPVESGAWEFKVAKKRNAVPKLKYEIMHSTDMVNWTPIEEGDPNWILTDDDVKSEIKVTSRDEDLTGGGFFQAKVSIK